MRRDQALDAKSHTTGDKSTQGFVTHRCDAMPAGWSLRKHDAKSYMHDAGVWVLGHHESDWDWGCEYLEELTPFESNHVRFCPWCGEPLS